MSTMGINLFGTYFSLPEDAQRTQEALVRARDFNSKSQKCLAVGNMVKFMALSILNCPLYLADACVGGLLIMRPIERFRQQGASFCKSILFFFCGIYLLAEIIFHGAVCAQSQEERQAVFEAQQQAALEAKRQAEQAEQAAFEAKRQAEQAALEAQQQAALEAKRKAEQAALEAKRKAEVISQFQSKFTDELKAKLEFQLQTQYKERLQEYISFLFKNPSLQKWFAGQLQEWFKDLHSKVLNILYSKHKNQWSHPLLYLGPQYKDMQELLEYWIRRRFLTLLRNSSQDLRQTMLQDFPEDLRNSQIKWEHLGSLGSNEYRINEYLCQDLLLDFLPISLLDRKDELQTLTTNTSQEQLQTMGEKLCQDLYSRLYQKLNADLAELVSLEKGWWFGGDLFFHTIARERHNCTIVDSFRDFLKNATMTKNGFHPQVISLIKDYLTTQIEPRIQAQFQPWFASRLHGRIQVLFPELNPNRQEWLQKWLQNWMRAPVSKLSEILEDDHMSLPFFQGLTPEESLDLQNFLDHQRRERLYVLLCGQVQDLCQVTLIDRPEDLHQYTCLYLDGRSEMLELRAQQTPYGHCLDVVWRSNFLRECVLQDMIWDLVPQLLKGRKIQLQNLNSDTPTEQLRNLEEELCKDLIKEFRKRMLKDLKQVSTKLSLSRQFARLLKEVFLYLRDNPHPLAPPPDLSPNPAPSSHPALE